MPPADDRCLQLEDCLRAAGIAIPPRPVVGGGGGAAQPQLAVAGAVPPVARAAARLGVQLGRDAGDFQSLLRGSAAEAQAMSS